MNVLYTVIDNPVTVSVADINQIKYLSMNGGSIKLWQEKGEYMVTPDNEMRGKNVSISVSVRVMMVKENLLEKWILGLKSLILRFFI